MFASLYYIGNLNFPNNFSVYYRTGNSRRRQEGRLS